MRHFFFTLTILSMLIPHAIFAQVIVSPDIIDRQNIVSVENNASSGVFLDTQSWDVILRSSRIFGALILIALIYIFLKTFTQYMVWSGENDVKSAMIAETIKWFILTLVMILLFWISGRYLR